MSLYLPDPAAKPEALGSPKPYEFGNFEVTVVTSAAVALAVDRVGPAKLALLGGLLQASALLLMALSEGCRG